MIFTIPGFAVISPVAGNYNEALAYSLGEAYPSLCILLCIPNAVVKPNCW